MSIEKQVELECPYCHKKQQTTVWSSINVQADPLAKQQLMEAKINVLFCQKCGKRANIANELLYHDMLEGFWVQFIPFDALEAKNLLDRFTPEGEKKYDYQGHDRGYISRPPHLVFDMGELVRYVIFRDRLFAECQAGDR